jgi:4'-phosphopantetheinyl transferase
MSIGRGELHVWSANLDACPSRHSRTLSIAELARAERILPERRRARWIAARAFLRMLLGAYLQADPASLRFELEHRGKPTLAPQHGGSPRFNLSHSGPIALCALTHSCAVGVDVQLASTEPRLRALAPRVLGAKRARQLCALPEDIIERELLHAWVELEAERKRTGAGLRTGLSGDLSAGSRLRSETGESTHRSPLGEPPGGAEAWLERLELGEDCAAAVALTQPPVELQLRAWCW